MLNQGFVAVRDQETEHAGFVCLKFMTDIFTSYLYLVYILNDELWMIDPDKAVRVHVLDRHTSVSLRLVNDEKLLEEILPQLKNKMALMKKFVTARRYFFH